MALPGSVVSRLALVVTPLCLIAVLFAIILFADEYLLPNPLPTLSVQRDIVDPGHLDVISNIVDGIANSAITIALASFILVGYALSHYDRSCRGSTQLLTLVLAGAYAVSVTLAVFFAFKLRIALLWQTRYLQIDIERLAGSLGLSLWFLLASTILGLSIIFLWVFYCNPAKGA
jgi:hypothetical protein